jgi:hypothetical protein
VLVLALGQLCDDVRQERASVVVYCVSYTSTPTLPPCHPVARGVPCLRACLLACLPACLLACFPALPASHAIALFSRQARGR